MTHQIYCVNIFLAYTKKIGVRTREQILFLIYLQETWDKSSSANEGNLTNDINRNLENEEEYLRVTEVHFLLFFI